MLNKKALSPVVGTALLLVVAVVAVVGFQGWFQTFSSNLFVDVEQQGSISNLDLGIETLVGSNLYIKAGNGLNITSVSIDGNDCAISGIYFNMSEIDVSDCLESVTSTRPEIVLVTDKGVSSKYVLLSGVSQGSSSLSSTNPRAAPECYTALTNTLGSWSGCQDMLIVNRSMLDTATSNNPINGGEDYYIGFGGQNYTFGDSDYNIFVGQVTDMDWLFSWTTFNSNINYWDVSSVTTMRGMFGWNDFFNQPLNYWDVSNVTDKNFMFQLAIEFNQPLNNWDVSNVDGMWAMFSGATSFNQPLNSWNVGNVTIMENMFWAANSFNQPLNSWNVSSVTNMWSMFRDAINFNQPLNNWDTSSVTDMSYMFYNAFSFNQNLSMWDVSSTTNCDDFDGFSGGLIRPNFISCDPDS